MMAEEVTARVSCYFNKAGCPKHYTGYCYLKTALSYIAEAAGNNIAMTKAVYHHVAEQYNTDIANVERCLRTLVHKWWEQCHCGGLFSVRPTNKQLLMCVSEHVCEDFLSDTLKDKKRKKNKKVGSL